MNPVVPKIRVGDVLHGTKNLRSYLRTCSLLRYLREVGNHYGNQRDLKKLLYTPNKKDSFVVSVNNFGRFCVWSPNMNVVLMFINATRSEGLYGNRMDPKIFAQWFVRTPGRQPAVTRWPVHAHYMWASLQMNAWRNPEIRLQINHLPHQEASAIPFLLAESVASQGIDHTTINQAAREAVVRGVFRNTPTRSKKNNDPFSGLEYGPSLGDLPALRQSLEHAMRDPRVISKIKKEGEGKMDQILLHVFKNPQTG